MSTNNGTQSRQLSAIPPKGVDELVRLLKLNGAQTAQAFKVFVTPELARILLTLQGHQRPIRSGNMRRLRKILREGGFSYTGQGISFDIEGRGTDGQHRLRAILEENTGAWLLIIVGVDRDAWMNTDQGSMRSASDMLPANTSNRTIVAAILAYFASELDGSIRYKRSSSFPAPDAVEMLPRFPITIEAASEAARIHDKVKMVPSLLGYCIARAYLVDRPAAIEFFARLADGVGLAGDSPAYMLSRRLMTNALSKSKLPNEEILALVIKAWRAHLSGHRVGRLMWHGTPIMRNGQQVEPEPFPQWPGLPLKDLASR